MLLTVQRLALAACAATVVSLGSLGCSGSGANVPGRSADADRWLARATQSYRAGDAEDAHDAIKSALKAAPEDETTRVLAARIALARLEYTEAAKLTEGLTSSEAKGLRGRALWYGGDMDAAADELEDMLRDPSVKDPWARDVSKLARRGQGRHPFAVEGAFLAAVEMPPAGPALIVPLELDGERVFGLVATNFGEVMIDGATRKEPAWVNLRFGDAFEVKDVPALSHDLSAISRQLGAPIKALLGVNLLRRLHVTFDRRASQFVVRKSDPAPPPEALRTSIFYARGGAMLMRGAVSTKPEGESLFFVDSSAFYPLALDAERLSRAGANLSDFRSEPGAPPSWKMGTIPYFKIAGLDMPHLPALSGPNIDEYRQKFEVELGGVMGAGLLSAFRVTFTEGGRWLWLEPDPSIALPVRPGRSATPAAGGKS